MSKFTNNGLVSSAIAAGVLLAGCAAGQAGDAFDPSKPVAKPAAEVPWVDVNAAIRFDRTAI